MYSKLNNQTLHNRLVWKCLLFYFRFGALVPYNTMSEHRRTNSISKTLDKVKKHKRKLTENTNVKATSQKQTPQHHRSRQWNAPSLIDSGLLLPTPVGEESYFLWSQPVFWISIMRFVWQEHHIPVRCRSAWNKWRLIFYILFLMV